MQRGIVWIVDDDSSIRWVLERAPTGAGLSCAHIESAKDVIGDLSTKTPAVFVSEYRMTGLGGLEPLTTLQQRHAIPLDIH
ncbi:MAG TPA: nitrogen regulation protein NR(I), partial [Pantoea sp.]|nr:nitrogen regulation protein NR(I) [Pantoea sp.]